MKKVVILHSQVASDAPKDDQDVLVQKEAVTRALEALGYSAEPVVFTLDLKSVAETLREIEPLFVFNLVESVSGMGRLIHLAPTLLEAFHIPYTGSGTTAIFLTSNKVTAKKMLKDEELRTPEAFTKEELKNIRDINGRYIIKSVWEHASIGLDDGSVATVKSVSQLYEHFEKRCFSGDDYFAEAYIEGREFNLSLLADKEGPIVLPPAEICFNAYPEGKLRIVDYRAKWEEDSFEYHNTPRSFTFSKDDNDLISTLEDMALQCWHVFGIRGYARVDFRVDISGKPWILEVNANPCLSPDSGFIAAASQAGLNYDDVILKILEDIK